MRAGRKDETTLVDDLVKARHYIDRLIKKHEDEAARRERFDRAWDKLAERNAETKAAEYVTDLGELKNETNPETILANAPATPEQVAVAMAWPCWVFRRSAPREYAIAGPYPTREAARRALDPGRTDERVVMADDPYLVESDVVERLFT